ncbi:MAG TPA: Ku protein [Terriglobales bacterium]|nr:Ku protein [Terriglobales bacterium]
MASTVWRGHLTFGLVSLPVKLYSAARGETISFNQLHEKDNSRVKNVVYCQLEDKPISRDEIVKGFEYEKGQYVVIDEEDIKKAAPPSARNMEIQEFVKSEEIDPVYFETSYYMVPDEAGEKPYALLFEGMRRTGYMGIAKVAMHNREYVVILRPADRGILIHTMYYADEVRKVDEFRTDTSLVKDKELQLAQTLIESLSGPFEPEKYKDTYRENLKALIAAKVEGREIVEPPHAERLAPVVDIMDALRMSLDKVKKPVRGVKEPGRAEAAQEEERAPKKRSRKTATG